MTRILFWPSATVLLLGILVLPACGPQDTPESVLADCSGHIPREKVGHCLERAHAFDQYNSSPDLQALETKLQQRALRRDQREAQAAPPSGYDSNQPVGYASDREPGYAPDRGPPPQDYGNHQAPPPDGDVSPPPEGPRGDLSPPVDRSGLGDLSPPDDGQQGPPPDDPRPPDDETQGPGQ